ncbi:MAG: hypothetical protein H0X38_04290 [Planctomycetes bacterium]|nr:hypothetical protein [Planctomycetota bacterium]
MRTYPVAVLAAMASTLVALAGCGSGGGGYGGGGSGNPPPHYINGTTTGQFGDNDLGFFQGALTVPSTITTATPSPILRFDIGNGFHSTVTNVHWSIQKNGVAFTSGIVATLATLDSINIDVPIPATVGSAVYRITIDDTGNFAETNENNNFVEFTVTVAASG